MKQQQRGGTVIGFILGVLVGLGAALAVAVYVTKVPVPFLNKAGSRTAEHDAAEAQKNKNWDPNAPLYGKNPAKVAAPAASAPAEAASAAPATTTAAASTPKAAASKASAAGKGEAKSADPLGDLANAKAKAASAVSVDPFDYFVQAGAFPNQAAADAQKAKLAMMGWEARVSEREQNGRTVFRVRIGPFGKRADAEELKDKLTTAGVETALVRVQR